MIFVNEALKYTLLSSRVIFVQFSFGYFREFNFNSRTIQFPSFSHLLHSIRDRLSNTPWSTVVAAEAMEAAIGAEAEAEAVGEAEDGRTDPTETGLTDRETATVRDWANRTSIDRDPTATNATIGRTMIGT